jgi:hypothetical protein
VSPNVGLVDPDRLAHILEGEDSSHGGHRWPPNPQGGTAGPGGVNDPKTPFPRTWNDDRIVDVVADIATDPGTEWVQQTGPGTGARVRGWPTRPPTTAAGAPVRYRAEVVVNGVTIRVIAEPGGVGVVTAFPVGYQDPASLLPFIRPPTTSTDREQAR